MPDLVDSGKLNSISTTTIISNGVKNKEISIFQRLLWLLNIIYYQVVAVLTVAMVWIFFNESEEKNVMFWHMILCTTAYVPLMAVAIIAFSEDNLPTQYIQRSKIYWIHGVLLSISCVAVTVGICMETNSKNKNTRGPGPAVHFKSDHAILGLVSWVLVLVSVVIGLLAANTRLISTFVKPIVTKLFHNFLGIGAFVLGVASLMLEFESHHYKGNLPDSAYKASYYAGAYIIIWSLLAAFKSLYFQLRGMFS